MPHWRVRADGRKSRGKTGLVTAGPPTVQLYRFRILWTAQHAFFRQLEEWLGRVDVVSRFNYYSFFSFSFVRT